MLIMGEYDCIPDIENLVVYNLSSLMEGYERLNILPPFLNMDYNSLEFDYYYADYILSNDNIFFDLFHKIIYQLYLGNNVYIMVGRQPFYDSVSESLLKFIQQRYYYHGAIVNTIEDIDMLNRDEGFGINGIANLDFDKERYSVLYVKYSNLTEQLLRE